ncbi:MAG TPA: hypothetical protein VD927_15615 [Chryseosolibacter sp.]|nr:hypothetical protein [Chryseosolibacter sp.]
MRKIILLGMLLHSVACVAQDAPQKMIDRFFDLYKTKSADEAIDYIFTTNKWMDDAKDDIENVKFKLNSTLKQLGEYEGYNLITTKSVGDHLTLYTFMVRYDRQPLRFSLLFYKPSAEWKLLNFSYDDDLSSELDEAAKAYRLKANLEY